MRVRGKSYTKKHLSISIEIVQVSMKKKGKVIFAKMAKVRQLPKAVFWSQIATGHSGVPWFET
jgi:hypothetical protein